MRQNIEVTIQVQELKIQAINISNFFDINYKYCIISHDQF